MTQFMLNLKLAMEQKWVSFLRNKDKFKGWKVEWIMRPRYRVKGMDGIEDTLR